MAINYRVRPFGASDEDATGCEIDENGNRVLLFMQRVGPRAANAPALRSEARDSSSKLRQYWDGERAKLRITDAQRTSDYWERQRRRLRYRASE
jgi:hypothetical protein